MLRYYEILTEINLEEVKKMHPKEAKLQLAQSIVEMFHPVSEAARARAHFENTFSQHQIPENIPEFKIESGQKLVDILVLTQMVASKNEGRRLIKEKAVSHEGKLIDDENWPLETGVLKIGKRRFLKLK
jgi:tyrosyl-tRNA synthetase